MTSPTVPDAVLQDLASLHLEVPEGELALLARYLDLLLEVNQRFNLTAIRDRDTAWRRHIVDSLTLLPVLAEVPAGASVVDVGSGGGLPGLPIAITRPDLWLTLVEATGKKARFLEQCARDLGLAHVKVVADRAETVGQSREHRQQYDVALCRAVGPMAELLEYTLPLVKVGGQLLAMKGPSVEGELEQASDAMDLLGAGELAIVPAYPESFNLDTVIVRIVKERPTPRTYPRLPGLPRQHPL